MNPLTLVDICKPIVASIKDSKASIDFWEKLSEKIKSHNEEACALAMVQVANVYLHGLKDEGKTKVLLPFALRLILFRHNTKPHYDHFIFIYDFIFLLTKQLIEEIGELVHGFEFVGKVHQEFYLLSSEFAKVQGDYANYYASTLRYLGCLDISTQSPEVNTALALHLSLAALLGNNVFNFGELLAHPILDYLRQSNEKWLLQVLTAFNEGNVLVIIGIILEIKSVLASAS